MIQANELRIGNWYSHYGAHAQASHVTISEVWEAERKWCEPIPLTPEILEKCGFEYLPKTDCMGKVKPVQKGIKSYSLKTKKQIRLWIVHRATGINISITPKFGGGSNYAAFKHIASLHQLQNFYFALTGEELNYTP